MKKLFIFIGGVATGIILTFIVCMLIAKNSVDNNYGITLFETEGDCVSENSFKVFHVLDSGDALATEMEHGIAIGVTVLFLSENGQTYYDEQIIRIPTGKCAKQIGTYKYPAQSGMEKTVPIVRILNE